MEDDFRPYVFFEVGSYWVYTLEGGTQTDSILLYENDLSINDTRRAYSFNYEWFNHYFQSSYYRDTVIGFGTAQRYRDTVFYVYAQAPLTYSGDLRPLFFTRHSPDATFEFTHDSQVRYLDYLPTFTVNGIAYSDVQVFENTMVYGPRDITKIYFAKGVGAIRKELSNGEIWNLARYKFP